MKMKLSSAEKLSLLLGLMALLVWSGYARADSKRTAQAATNPGRQPVTNAAPVYQQVSFETLAAYDIKVDWLINPTNSSLDTVRREGNIPDSVRLLHGKKVTLQGYIKPLKQDNGGVMDFLLMRNHALCCQTNIPQINEWVHVRMTGRSIPFAHERRFIVRGELQVGEKLGAGNVVSVYRLIGEEIIAGSEAR